MLVVLLELVGEKVNNQTLICRTVDVDVDADCVAQCLHYIHHVPIYRTYGF